MSDWVIVSDGTKKSITGIPQLFRKAGRWIHIIIDTPKKGTVLGNGENSGARRRAAHGKR